MTTLGIIIWVVYLVLYLLAPVSGNTYSLSYGMLFVIKLTVALPILAIWLTALWGVRQFRHYALAIQESLDGLALLIVANGLVLVIFGLISQTFIGAVIPYAGAAWLNWAVFAHNHVPVAIQLGGFMLILVGARRLARSAGLRISLEHSFGLLLPYMTLGAIFGWYFYQHFEVVITGGVPNFATNATVAFWTIALPSIATWLAGVLAVANIYEYANHVRGKIYRKALRNLVRGISLAVLLSVTIQVLSLGTQFFAHLGLASLLAVLYLLLVLYAGGFVFIARGARALMRIEEAT